MADFAPFKIIVKNTSIKAEYDPDTQTQWYKWAIHIESDPPNALETNVDHVVYHLHSSFPENEIRVDKNIPKFKLASKGWGEFTINIDLFLRDNEKTTIKHYLSLSEGTSTTTHFIEPNKLTQ
jgi:transcription initiation factor IIF auxiliary subunit